MLIVAAVGWLGAGLLAPQTLAHDSHQDQPAPQTSLEKQPDPQESASDDDLRRAQWRTLGGEKVKGGPDTYRAICDQPGYHDNADLCQQWRTAEAAEETAFWAKAQFYVSVVGTVGLIVTIIIGFVSAKASRDTVLVSRDTASKQLRAYVACTYRYVFSFDEHTPCRVNPDYAPRWL
jgi:hypothetical protein